MRTKILIILCLALFVCSEVYAQELDVKRGMFPYMAFIYYPDDTVLDGSGARFLRGAVLIRPSWLVTSAVGPSLTQGPNGFPQKTLLARAGAISIDDKFTLNEDEDEQEREIIQIIRPYNHSATQWWQTDISLMKTLLPFNLTPAVGVSMLQNKAEYVDKTCIMLVYAKKEANSTDGRSLLQMSVETLPGSVENCGYHYLGKNMICATDVEEKKIASKDPNFCQGNSGGPLVCEGDVIGLQTYIDNDCKPPHLYQVLSFWEEFIACGTENKCHEEQCSLTCDVADKDAVELNALESATLNATTSSMVSLVTELTATLTSVAASVPKLTSENDLLPVLTSMIPAANNDEGAAPEELSTEETIKSSAASTIKETATTETATSPTPEESSTSVTPETTTGKVWPKELILRNSTYKNRDDILDKISNRQTKVEARQQQKPKVVTRGHGETNKLHHSLIFVYFIVACLII